MKTILIFFLVLPCLANARNIPNEKIIPPESLFGDRYDRSENDPKWNEYLDGKPVELKGEHEAIRLEFSDTIFAHLLIVVCKDSKVAIANFEDGRKKMLEKGMSTLSDIEEAEKKRSFTIETLGRYACSMVIENVHFVINDPGGNAGKKRVLEWSEKYANFLLDSLPSDKADPSGQVEVEDWTGSNGKIIQGMVHGLSEDGLKVDFTGKGGNRIPKLPLRKFSESDQKKIVERFK